MKDEFRDAIRIESTDDPDGIEDEEEPEHNRILHITSIRKPEEVPYESVWVRKLRN